MERKLRSLGIRQSGDIRCLIEQNNNLPYSKRDKRLSALYDVIVQYNTTAPKRKRVTSSVDAYACFAPHMQDLEQEEVWVLYLNKVNDVLDIKRMFVGGLDSSMMDVRLVIKEAILKRATGVIVAHNHPSGEVKPSKVDINMTEKLKKAVNLCDISLLDHIVVSGMKFYSMADEGIL